MGFFKNACFLPSGKMGAGLSSELGKVMAVRKRSGGPPESHPCQYKLLIYLFILQLWWTLEKVVTCTQQNLEVMPSSYYQ